MARVNRGLTVFYLFMAFCGPERCFRSPFATILQRRVTSAQRPLTAEKKKHNRKRENLLCAIWVIKPSINSEDNTQMHSFKLNPSYL